MDEETDGDKPKEVESNLGEYWKNGTITTDGEQYVLVAIEVYGTSHALRSTPQYGYNCGMKALGDSEYQATQEKVDDNLICMGAIKMLKPSKMTPIIYCNNLSYLTFLKRKRIEKIKQNLPLTLNILY